MNVALTNAVNDALAVIKTMEDSQSAQEYVNSLMANLAQTADDPSYGITGADLDQANSILFMALDRRFGGGGGDTQFTQTEPETNDYSVSATDVASPQFQTVPQADASTRPGTTVIAPPQVNVTFQAPAPLWSKPGFWIAAGVVVLAGGFGVWLWSRGR